MAANPIMAALASAIAFVLSFWERHSRSMMTNGEKGDSCGYQSMSKDIMHNDKNGHQSVHRRSTDAGGY
jgi:hypothetical protein